MLGFCRILNIAAVVLLLLLFINFQFIDSFLISGVNSKIVFSGFGLVVSLIMLVVGFIIKFRMQGDHKTGTTLMVVSIFVVALYAFSATFLGAAALVLSFVSLKFLA